jgi:hypothetical protein
MEHSEAENIFIAFVVTSLEMVFGNEWLVTIYMSNFLHFHIKKTLLLKLLLP